MKVSLSSSFSLPFLRYLFIHSFIDLSSRELLSVVIRHRAGEGVFLTTGALILCRQLRKSELDVRIKTLGNKGSKSRRKAKAPSLLFFRQLEAFCFLSEAID